MKISRIKLVSGKLSPQYFSSLPNGENITGELSRLAKSIRVGSVTQHLVDTIINDTGLQDTLLARDKNKALDVLSERFVLKGGILNPEELVLDIEEEFFKGKISQLVLETGERVRGKYKLDTKFLQSQFKARNLNPKLADDFLQVYGEHSRIMSEINQLRSQQKLKFKSRPTPEEITEAKDKGERIKSQIAEKELVLKELRFRLANLALSLPNLFHETVPVGQDETANEIIRTWGEPNTFNFEPKDHVSIGENLGILDFRRGAMLAQSRFVAHRGVGSLLERALIQFMLDLHTREHGYTEWWLPELVNSATMFGTGQFPNFAEQMFSCMLDDLHLIPTAEVPLTNLHRNEIIKNNDLPLRYTAYTSCFRREAGSAGKDVRGMIRVHQFDKVELVSITHPENSFDELERMVTCAEEVLKKLKLPFRTVLLSSGDMGTASAKTYDLEVWLPNQGKYREISSCSNCTDWQSRRLETRFIDKKGGKPQYVHTLNGSGIAVGRTLVAILENFQQEDGSVIVPEALKPYMNGLNKISNKGLEE
jgi:seryl-tRNA synthetase